MKTSILVRTVLFTAAGVLLFLNVYASVQKSLYVFLPSEVRPRVLQNKLEGSCSGTQVTVFSRYRDFKAGISSAPPTAVLANPRLIRLLDGYSVQLVGSFKGSETESYVLLSLPGKLKDPLGDNVVGVLDFLGKSEMKSFLREKLGDTPKIKRVTKVEDLPPLLNFGMVDAVFIPRRFIASMEKLTNMKLTVHHVINAKSGIAALAVKGNAPDNALPHCLRTLPRDFSLILGVDAWKEQ